MFRQSDCEYLQSLSATQVYVPVDDSDPTWSANALLKESCFYGNLFLTNKAIANGATSWDWGLYGACYGGHRDMAEFMIEKGATDWNLGLYGACYGGHRDMAEWMIEKGGRVGEESLSRG